MNKTQAKQHIKNYGIYSALFVLSEMGYVEGHNLLEIIERVLDNIPDEILKKAIKEGTK